MTALECNEWGIHTAAGIQLVNLSSLHVAASEIIWEGNVKLPIDLFNLRLKKPLNAPSSYTLSAIQNEGFNS